MRFPPRLRLTRSRLRATRSDIRHSPDPGSNTDEGHCAANFPRCPSSPTAQARRVQPVGTMVRNVMACGSRTYSLMTWWLAAVCSIPGQLVKPLRRHVPSGAAAFFIFAVSACGSDRTTGWTVASGSAPDASGTPHADAGGNEVADGATSEGADALVADV